MSKNPPKLTIKLRNKRSSILQDIDESSSDFASKSGKLYEIENILVEGIWADEKTGYYYVKWKGFGDEHNSFVDIKDVTDQLNEWWSKEILLRYPLMNRNDIVVQSLHRKQFFGSRIHGVSGYNNNYTLREPILRIIGEWTDSDGVLDSTEKKKQKNVG